MNSEPAASLRPCKIHRLKETIAISIPTRACRHRLLLFAASAWAAGLLSSAAMAQAPSAYREIRLSLLAHDVAFTGGVEPGADINFEVTSSSIIDQEWTGSLPIWAQWAVYPRLDLGVEITYRISPTISIGIYYDHESNGGLVRYNRSLNDFGARVAYRF